MYNHDHDHHSGNHYATGGYVFSNQALLSPWDVLDSCASPFSNTKFCLTSDCLGDFLLGWPTHGALFCYMASHLWLSFSGHIQWLSRPCLWILHHGYGWSGRNIALIFPGTFTLVSFLGMGVGRRSSYLRGGTRSVLEKNYTTTPK